MSNETIQHEAGPNSLNLGPILSSVYRHGWPTVLMSLLILAFWLYGIPAIDRVVDSHVRFVDGVREATKQTEKTLIILEERDRSREAQLKKVTEVLERILDDQTKNDGG